ncbi:rhamnulokinase family protein [Paenibacillus sp. FSL P4-0338]|uniref:rhamnulokinase n=1 Tax=unclassified Paenibacillus TaxID=185978 RepID=UPI0003E204D7|nr:rhamnulokinase family protein [Paenibacillus sp. FSL R7-269]ETT44355.1 carbohydrate kinase FGGY [Paenibacillus sp. FSL R7-269]
MTEAKTQAMDITGDPEIRLLAIDLGASSGRVMLGSYRDGKVTVEEIHRFPNGPVEVNGHLHWDVQRLLQEIKQGIAAAAASYGPLHSLSVDTWGVDYGLLDEQGELLDVPHHYRDQRMTDIASVLEAALPPAEQFKLTGNQSSPINTVYQLFADLMAKLELRTTAKQLLMMPDLFNYMLSGVAVAEQTIWSTSGLLNPQSTAPSAEVLRRLELPAALLPRLVPAGTVLGELRTTLQEELGSGPLQIIAGASHDTASAVASIPYGGFSSSYAESSNADSGCVDPGCGDQDRIDGFSDPLPSAAFISCGTWSLVGLETAEPVLSDAARASGFTNESCFGGTNRLLKNITGLWLLQETQRSWAEAGEPLSHQEAAELAGQLDRQGACIAELDPNDPLFSTPGDMPLRIESYCIRTGQPVPQTRAEIIRSILESLARSYADTIRELEALTGRPVRCIHMVGGGIQNKLLCQLTADATGKYVIAGPVEASAIGNILVQLTALGTIDPAEVRRVAARSCSTLRYQPSLSHQN